MKILSIDSSPAAFEASASRQIVKAVVETLVAQKPGSTVVYRDLEADPLPHFDAAAVAALRPAPGADTLYNSASALSAEILKEFLEAEVIVIGAPMYNFSVPTQLKAWIDRVAQPGKTFGYTANGPQGLAGGRRVIIASSRGGAYAGAAYEKAMDHQEAYLSAFFNFIGIDQVEFVRAEGLAMGSADAVLQGALEQARAVKA